MEPSENKPVILVVDDTPANIQILQEILTPSYKVKVATNGEKALRLAKGDDPPDLILLDIMMPGMDGYEVCRILKSEENTRKIPVIFVTAKEETVDEQQGFDVGAVDYITKPVNPPIVASRVAAHLALRQAMASLEKQNELLRENERLRDQVERIMRHDLKTPLTAFIGIPGLLKRRKELPADVLETIAMMEKSGYRMLEMINRSMDLYRMETGSYSVKPVPVDILKNLRQIQFELSEVLKAGEKKLILEFAGRPAQENDEFKIQGEDYLFYSMLANLTKNAVEACPGWGTVKVVCESQPFPKISVQNPGVIPIEIRDRFMQKHVTHGKRGGTGLGGYSARLMAQTMGGEIRFTTSENQGTNIMVEFKAQGEPGAHGAAPAAGGPGGTVAGIEQLRVLVVDDNGIIRFTVNQVLREIGFHEVVLAKDAEEGMLFLKKNLPVHLIISDWNMPGMDGGEFLDWIRKESSCRNVPFIMVTADSRPDNIRTAAERGVTDFVVKPFSPDLLRTRVENLLPRMRIQGR